MKILIIASDKGGHFVPFIEEQITALQARGVQIVRYGVTGKGITGYLRELPALRRLIRAERPNIIHAHYGLCGLLANLQRMVPVVTTYHGSDINVPSILRISKIAMRLSAHNIFVSARSASLAIGNGQWANSECKVESVKFKGEDDECKVESVKFKGEETGKADTSASTLYTLHPTQTEASTPYTLHPTPKNTLLPCGVNLTDDQLLSRSEARTALGIAEDVKVILFAGAFDNAVKDAPLAQAAVAALPASTPYTLHLTPILQELRGFSRAEVNCWMCAANALLMTSKTEGSPQVIKEAMACGCPIVSVDVGDVAERTSGVEGCYVVPSREPKDIAQALVQAIAFIGNTNGREKIIEMGLSNEQVAEQLLHIYKQLLV
jgi:glycosyltransferase involved in cell wall biosynthesis